MHQRKNNVAPGMLAYVVATPGKPVNTPDLVGRFVFVERLSVPNEILTHVDGRKMLCNRQESIAGLGTLWWITAKEPLPCVVHTDGVPDLEQWWCYARPILDESLRPVLGPGLDITDEEVQNLYSAKEKETV